MALSCCVGVAHAGEDAYCRMVLGEDDGALPAGLYCLAARLIKEEYLHRKQKTASQRTRSALLTHYVATHNRRLIHQSFTMWKANATSCLRRARKKRVIYIQPLGPFPDVVSDFVADTPTSSSVGLCDVLLQFVQLYFTGFAVSLLPAWDESALALRRRRHVTTGEPQLLTGAVQRALAARRPRDGFCTIGVSWTDLYPSKKLNFVLGEAKVDKRAAVISFGRFEPKTIEETGRKNDVSVIDGFILWRLLKVISHETAHLFGLLHCSYFECAMNESSFIDEAMSQPLLLCPVCLKKLQTCCNFSIAERYHRLQLFMERLNSQYPHDRLEATIHWLQEMNKFLTS